MSPTLLVCATSLSRVCIFMALKYPTALCKLDITVHNKEISAIYMYFMHVQMTSCFAFLYEQPIEM